MKTELRKFERGGKSYILESNSYRTDVFEVVDRIPAGYRVWNINLKDRSGYIPLCELLPGTYSVNRETLKTIRIDNLGVIEVLAKAVPKGACCKQAAAALVKNPTEYCPRELAELALRVFEVYEEA